MEFGAALFPKMAQHSTFEVRPESNCIDVQVAGDQASCYGVNLAFAGFGVRLGLFGPSFLEVVR
jgi:hypothetical protein